MIITTTHEVADYTIEKIIDVITANQVLGNNIISENIASFTDIFGGKSGQYRAKLNEIVSDAKEQLINMAIDKGANAILGLTISTNQISAKGMSMFMITATGTAVKLVPDRMCLAKKLHDLYIYKQEGIISDEEYNFEADRLQKNYTNAFSLEMKQAEAEQKYFAEEKERKIKEEEKRKELAALREKEKEEYYIRIKSMKDKIDKELPLHKNDVYKLTDDMILNASYDGKIPVTDANHYDIIRYLVAIGESAAAAKYYIDRFHLTPTDALSYMKVVC